MKVNSKKVLAQLMAVAVVGTTFSVPVACMTQPVISVNAKETAGNQIQIGEQYGGSWFDGDGYAVSRYMNTFIMNADGTSKFESAPTTSFPRIFNFASSSYENGVYHLSDGTFQDGNNGITTGVTGTVTVNSDGSISFKSSVDNYYDNKMVLINPPVTTTTTEEVTTTSTTEAPAVTTTATTEARTAQATLISIAKPPVANATAQQSDGWKKAYTDFLKEKYAKDKNLRFALAYVDDNDVPELITASGDYHAVGSQVYVYNNGNVVQLSGGSSDYGRFYYVEKSNIMYATHTTNGNGGLGQELCCIKNGELERIVYFYESDSLETGNRIYKVDDVTVTEEQYNAKLKEYQIASGTAMGKTLTSIPYSNMYEITDSNISKYIGTPTATTTTTTITKTTTTTTTTSKASNVKSVGFKRGTTSDNKEYAVITALDSSGNTAWTYKTNSYPVNQSYVVEELGTHGNAYYLVENGMVTALDLATGKVLWQNSDLNSYGVHCAFGENAIYIVSGLGADFYAIDYSGKTLKRISHLKDDYGDTQYYWADKISLINDEKYAGVHFNANDKTLYVNLETYEILDKAPEKTPATTTRTAISTAATKVTTTAVVTTTVPAVVKPYSWYLSPSIEAEDIIVSDDSFDVTTVENQGSDTYAFIKRDGKYNFISYDGKTALNKWYSEARIAECGDLGVYTGNTGVYYSSYDGSLSKEQSEVWLNRGANVSVYYVFAYDKNTSQIYHPVRIGEMPHWSSDCKMSCDYGTAILIEEATVKTGSSYPTIDYTGKYGTAYNNKVTVAPTYDDGIMNVYNDMIALKSGNKWGYFNGKTGEQVIDFIADEMASPYYTASVKNNIWNDSVYVEARPYTYSDGYVAIKNSDSWALYDESGDTVIDYGEFKQIRPVHNNKAWVQDNSTGLWGVIDLTGTTVVTPNGNTNNNNNNNSGGNTSSGNNSNTSGNNSNNNSSSSSSSGKEAPKTGDNFGLAVSALAVSAGVMVASRKRKKK